MAYSCVTHHSIIKSEIANSHLADWLMVVNKMKGSMIVSDPSENAEPSA